jgi:hypothetical protein
VDINIKGIRIVQKGQAKEDRNFAKSGFKTDFATEGKGGIDSVTESDIIEIRMK